MMVILQQLCCALRFDSGLRRAQDSFAFFFERWRGGAPLPISTVRAQGPTHGKKKTMQQLFRLSAAPVAGLFAMALAAITAPASAADYCRQDAISGMRSCSYATIEQCQAMSSGIGGTCYRDPFLAQSGASSAYAYAPHGGKHVTKPVEKH
jgi:hypothetical protein